MLVLHVAVLAFALLMLSRHGPAALLFVAPSLRRPSAAPSTPARTTAEARARDEVAALGFRHVGSLVERGPLGALSESHAVFASADGRTWADVGAGRHGAGVRLVSASPGGEILVTALPGASPAGALAAHEKGLEAFERRHGRASAPADLGARVEVARRFAAGPGRGQVRGATAMSFVNATLAVVLLATSVNGLAAGLKS